MSPMLELRLRSGSVVSFDGRVVEVFDGAGSSRLHVAQLGAPALTEPPGGGRLLSLGDGMLRVRFAAAELPALRRLLAALEAARDADSRLSAA